MKKIYLISICFLLTLSEFSQNWQFVHPFFQQNSFNTSAAYSPGKIKQFQSGKLIRYSSDENRAILQGYNSVGDSLWYFKKSHLYVSDLVVVDDNGVFCGLIDSSVVIQNQTYSCPDTCIYGITGVINSNGVFSNIKIFQGKNVSIQGIARFNNMFCLAGGFKKYSFFDTLFVAGSNDSQAFVALMNNNFEVQSVGYTSDGGGEGSAIASACSQDKSGNIWVMANTYHSLKWNVGSATSTFSSGTTSGGQQLFKLNSNLQYQWDKVLFMGIGPEIYEPCIFTDSGSAVIASLYSWGSGAGTHASIKKFAADGSIMWGKNFNSGLPILGMDSQTNIYTCTSENNFTLYKFAPDGTQLYANADTSWKQRIFEWQFVNENEFYGLGACDNNSNNCTGGQWYLTHYKPNSFTGWDNAKENSTIKSVYPNPSSGGLNVETAESLNNTTIRVINIYGQVIHSKKLNGKGLYHFDLSNEPKGIYIMQVEDDKIKSTHKIVIN